MSWCAHVTDMPQERPCIVLLLEPPLDAGAARLVGLGCEEESIPLAWDEARSPDDTAHAASLRSRLDVGILASGDRASIGAAQLPGRAWMEVEIKGPEDWRWVGQAASRLVKGQPMPSRERGKSSEREAAPLQRDDVPPSPVPTPQAGLCPVTAPYLEQRRMDHDGGFEALVALVTQKIAEQLRRRGE